MSNKAQDKEGKGLPESGVSLRAMAFFGIEAILAVCLLCGCGSDGKQPSAASGKKEKAVKSSSTPGATNLVVGSETGSGKVKKEPLPGNMEIHPGAGITVQEVMEKAAAERKRAEAPNYEVLPGITREKLEAKIAADRAKAGPPKSEPLPGLTKEVLDARIAESRKMTESPDHQVLPGVTKSQLEAKVAAEKLRREGNKEVLPGLTKEQLDANVQSQKSQN